LNNAKKILFALESFFPKHRAGTEVYVLNLCQYLVANDWKVAVLISDLYEKKYVFEGIPVYSFIIPEKPDVKELNGIIEPHGIQGFLNKVLEINPSIVHFHSFGRAINSFHLKRVKELGFKTVFTAHLGGLFCVKGTYLLFNNEVCNGEVQLNRCMACYLHDQSYPKIISKVASTLINISIKTPIKHLLPPTWNLFIHKKSELNRLSIYADSIIALAPWIKKVFDQNGIYNVTLVQQGIQVNGSKPSINPKNKGINLIFVGRIHWTKGLHLLLQALENIPRHTLHLTIVGIPQEPEFREIIYKKASRLCNVSWKENLNRLEVQEEIANADILVLPSISNEMAPLVILEAFDCGKPVIGSSYPAIVDMIIEDVNGLIFENNNVKSLTQCLNRLVNEPDLLPRLISNIHKPRTLDEVSSEMIDIYKSIL
jgi:glycosyltransferase involved in cell wall biosynthesis